MSKKGPSVHVVKSQTQPSKFVAEVEGNWSRLRGRLLRPRRLPRRFQLRSRTRARSWFTVVTGRFATRIAMGTTLFRHATRSG